MSSGTDGEAAAIATRSPSLRTDDGSFAAAIGRIPLPVAHTLAGEELLWPAAAKSLAQAVPPGWVTYHGAVLPTIMPSGGPPKLDRGVDEVFDELSQICASVRIYHLQHRDPYRGLVHGCLDEVEPLVGTTEGGMRERDASLFVGSPGAVVPAHFDRHHNVLLQITGSKDVFVGMFRDAAVGHEEIESQAGTGINHLHTLPEHVQVFHLEPGDGVYLPPYAFHWVEGREGVSVALSCSFSTEMSERTELVNRCNRRLRRIGMRPNPAGSGPARDATKAAVIRSWRALRRRPGRWSAAADRRA